MKQVINQLEKIEEKLDILNGELGNKKQYCIYCNSTEYDGNVGIVHYTECVIFQLRDLIKNLK